MCVPSPCWQSTAGERNPHKQALLYALQGFQSQAERFRHLVTAYKPVEVYLWALQGIVVLPLRMQPDVFREQLAVCFPERWP